MKKKKISDEMKFESESSLIEVLDKLLLLKETEKQPSFLRKTVYVVVAIAAVLFVTLICATIYKNNFTAESILSTLLAFFSIFMSVFFYFKADETSTKFYDSSYKFMKDISVTLGKIEERFGEKLNSLNDKVSHLDRESKQASEEIEDQQEDKDRIINELMEKANLNAEEKVAFKRELEEKDQEIARLQFFQMRAEQEARMLRRRIEKCPEPTGKMNIDREFICSRNGLNLSLGLIQSIIEMGQVPMDLPVRLRNNLKRAGCIDSDGNIVLDRLYELRNILCEE